MSYELGIDLGTTYTAAAVHRDGSATICTLGSRAATIPSVVLLRSDGTFLTGDAAERRAATEPERVVREFKRRFGDTTPIIVAGSPYSAEALTARLLAAVVDQVTEREGGDPRRIVVTHPANWGDYKTDLLGQAVRLAGIENTVVEFITEPEAAAISYAAQERVDPGEVVAVYDLGGGTFDAAVLRRTTNGFSIIGKPEGIERLGGIDFDAAVFAHIASGLGTALIDLDPEDPAVLAAVARLRRDCVEAKEALSSDTDTSVPIMLPGLQTEVRITRQEFESLIRPSLLDSTEAMKRAVRSAGTELDAISRILLVGGSSRIPVVAQLVASELGSPLAVDAHPKHTVALGAAHAASGRLDVGTGQAPSAVPPGPQPSHPPERSPSGVNRAAIDANRTVVSSPADLAPPPKINPARGLPPEPRPVEVQPPKPAAAGSAGREDLNRARPVAPGPATAANATPGQGSAGLSPAGPGPAGRGPAGQSPAGQGPGGPGLGGRGPVGQSPAGPGPAGPGPAGPGPGGQAPSGGSGKRPREEPRTPPAPPATKARPVGKARPVTNPGTAPPPSGSAPLRSADRQRGSAVPPNPPPTSAPPARRHPSAPPGRSRPAPPSGAGPSRPPAGGSRSRSAGSAPTSLSQPGDDAARTAVYQPPGPGRTSVYPAGARPDAGQERAAGGGSGGSTLPWLIAVLVVVAIIVVILLLLR